MLDLPFLNQVLHRACDVLDRHLRIDAVLIKQVDGIDVETLEQLLGNLSNTLRMAIETLPLARSRCRPPLSRRT